MIVFIQKQTFENFAFSILRILKLFSRETYKFFKKQTRLIMFYCFLMFVIKLFSISRAHLLKSKWCFKVKSSTNYFHMKTKILEDFQICICVPLIHIFFSFFIIANVKSSKQKGVRCKRITQSFHRITQYNQPNQLMNIALNFIWIHESH